MLWDYNSHQSPLSVIENAKQYGCHVIYVSSYCACHCTFTALPLLIISHLVIWSSFLLPCFVIILDFNVDRVMPVDIKLCV